MISYAPLWTTMEDKGITIYVLIAKHGVGSKTVYNLRHNKSITMFTLSKLCRILECTPNDIVKFISEN